MGIKIDRFTLAIIAGVLLLVIGAVITVTVTGGRGWQSAEYLNEDTPEAVVHDAFLAFVRNEPDVAMKHYSRDVLEDEDKVYIRERFNHYDSSRSARRLRILDVDINDEIDKAYVNVANRQLPPGRPLRQRHFDLPPHHSPGTRGRRLEDRHR